MSKINFRDMPKGMKVITVLMWISLFSETQGIFKSMQQDNFILGFQVHPPISSIYSLLMLIASVLILIGIYNRKWRQLILVVKGFILINFIPSVIIILNMSAEKMMSLAGDISNVPPDVVERLATTTKIVALSLMSFGFVVAIIIWIYIYRNKEYFSDKSSEIKIEPSVNNITN